MNHTSTRPRALGFILLVSVLTAASPALGYEPVKGTLRRLGGALEDEPLPIGGWRLGMGLTRPFGLGPSVAYLWPFSPVSAKVGCHWTWASDAGVTALNHPAGRFYAAAIYYLAPQSGQLAGPYVETGGGLVRGADERQDTWPLWPHLGFGHAGRINDTLAWDINFSVSGNGLICLEAGLLSGKVIQ